MSKIADNVSIVSAMTIPGPMLDRPVYCCDRWPVQNAYIEECGRQIQLCHSTVV